MNIQIFGKKKCNDTKKAERFFKECGIKYQFIDMKKSKCVYLSEEGKALARKLLDEYTFGDEFFMDANLYNPDGKNIMLLGLDVLPEYRRQGGRRMA
jgi:hypothetical protein